MSSKKFTKRRESAFSLIELLIVIAIIGISSTIMLVSLSQQKTQSDLNKEAHQIVAIIHEAQNDALTGKVNATNERPISYTVFFWRDTNSYQLTYTYAVVGGGTEQKTPYSRTLQNGVQFSGFTVNGRSMAFSPPRGEVTLSPATPVLSIKLVKGSQAMYICATWSGLVVEKGADSSCP